MILTPPAIHAKAEPVDRGQFLSALGQVESGLNLNAIGAHGERSAWQIKKTVWKYHMGPAYPFEEYASSPEVSALCARRRYDWIEQRLRSRDIEITPENLAAVWNLGLTGALRRIYAGTALPEYCTRVANLYRATLAVAPLRLER